MQIRSLIRWSIYLLLLALCLFFIISYFDRAEFYKTLKSVVGRKNYFYQLAVHSKDKHMHFFFMGAVSFCLNYLLFGKAYTFTSKYIVPWGVMILLIVTFLEEIRHFFLAHRSFELMDYLSGALGIVLFWICRYLFFSLSK